MNGFRPIRDGDHLMLLDASGYVYRAYHALPPLSRSDGHPTGAISGYCAMLWSLLSDEAIRPAPTHFAAVFDAGGANHRHELYPAYKATRPQTPSDLALQFSAVRRATEALGIPMVEKRGCEADDIIATYARRAARHGARVTIVSSDKDLRQLIDDRTTMFDPMKRVIVDAAAVEQRMGIPPCRVADYLALVGDITDNVPGVPGIGEKTAAILIKAHGDAPSIIEAAEAGKIEGMKGVRVRVHREALMLSLRLVALHDHIESLPSIAAFACGPVSTERFMSFLKDYELVALAARVERKAA